MSGHTTEWTYQVWMPSGIRLGAALKNPRLRNIYHRGHITAPTRKAARALVLQLHADAAGRMITCNKV